MRPSLRFQLVVNGFARGGSLNGLFGVAAPPRLRAHRGFDSERPIPKVDGSFLPLLMFFFEEALLLLLINTWTFAAEGPTIVT